MNPYLPYQGQLPLRRNPRMPFLPGMGGVNPLMAMSPSPSMSPALSLQLARAGRYNNPMYGAHASLVGGGPLYNPSLNQSMQRYYSPNSPSFVGPMGYPYGALSPYYSIPTSCSQCGGGHDDCCNKNDNSKEQTFKTKDVTVRGKARKVRASFLIEASKFEADLIKYMDKKKEDDVPDKVVDMLISFINHEDYKNSDILDEVTMNILASNVGAKSAVLHSLARLKKLEDDIDGKQIAKIIGTVIMSSKVDEGVTKWLKDYLKDRGQWRNLLHCAEYLDMIRERPEVEVELMRLLGLSPQPDDRWSRSL